jgi:hypothetical protein
VPCLVVVGKPITVTRNPDASKEEISALHAQILDAVQALYDHHKAAYGTDAKLVIK